MGSSSRRLSSLGAKSRALPRDIEISRTSKFHSTAVHAILRLHFREDAGETIEADHPQIVIGTWLFSLTSRDGAPGCSVEILRFALVPESCLQLCRERLGDSSRCWLPRSNTASA